MILLPFISNAKVSISLPSANDHALRFRQSRSIIRQAKVIITSMEPPDCIVSISEPRDSTGERGKRMFVALLSTVYDVTDYLRWKSGMHNLLHFPGQDMTSEPGKAPHLEEVFKRPCGMVVGRLDS